MENYLIKLIESLDKIMDTWDTLTLRRTLLMAFSINLFIHVTITFIVFLLGKEVSDTWRDILGMEYITLNIMIGFYFKGRSNSE